MKNSTFRHWVRNIWFDNCQEHMEMGLPKYTVEEYFQKFKWWLRREYRHQNNLTKK